MKFFTFLFAISATLCLIQAHKLKLELVTLYEGNVPTNGELTLLLKGETEAKKVVINETVFQSDQDFIFETEFDQDVKDVRVKWISESGEPIFLYYLVIVADKHQGSLFLMGKDVLNDVTQDFHVTNTFPV